VILFDLGALIYYLFIRTFYIEKCIWNDLEKKTLFENTFMIYLSLITTFGMYSPYILFDIYMLVSTGVSIGILHIGGYLLSTILFAAISLGIGYVIRLIHLSKAYKKPLSNLFFHYLNNIIIFVFAFLSVNLSNILFQQLGLIIIMICLVCYWIIGLSSNKFR